MPDFDAPALPPWIQRPGVPDRWYAVLLTFLRLGPTRNVARAVITHLTYDPTTPPPSTAVYHHAKTYAWADRAATWDALDPAARPALTEPPHTPLAYAPDRQIWDQQPGEHDREYARFRTFLSLGPDRSIPAALRQHRRQAQATENCSTHYYYVAKRWHWDTRADAYDLALTGAVFTHPVLSVASPSPLPMPDSVPPPDPPQHPWDRLPNEPAAECVKDFETNLAAN